MGTDYHRATSDSIPIQDENRPIAHHAPPQGHYSADTGEWDGQLPNADIVAPQPSGPEIQFQNWPTILERMAWARRVIRSHRLPPPQAAVLNEVVYRDGRGNGCSATMETLALDTGYNEKSIRTAIQGLENRTLVMSAGGPGRKKFLTLPVQDGLLLEPTPVTGSEVTPKGKNKTPVRGSGVEEIGEPTPVRDSGVDPNRSDLTPVTGTGVEPNPGNRFRATPVTGSDITGSKQEEREKNIYLSLSLPSSGLTGSPVTDSGVLPHDNPDPRSEMPGSRPTWVKEPDLVHQSTTPEQERIRDLVVQNWPLLEQSGWDYLDPAIRHYQTHGITYLERDLRVKSDNLRKAELATRTCVHCGTVHDTADKVKACIRCEDSICVDDRSSCRQHTCFRKQVGGSPDRGGGPADRLRR